ncbi:MAG: NADH-quinone reductase [Treponema sp. CETP13]|nr:MAG: NADH-quinone reductase [Treponema sp. CETP13]
MAPSDKNEIYISSSPHFKSKSSTQKIMLAVIISMLPIIISSIVIFGFAALEVVLTSVISCVVFEAAFQKVTKQPIRINNLSAVVTGLMLACVLPAGAPVWETILGSLVSIVVAKEFFGGLGSNVFNPALTGRAFMFLSFPTAMGLSWLKPGTDVLSGATMLSQLKTGTTVVATKSTYLQFFLGNRAGCLGETSIAFILLAFIVLTALKVIDWRAPVAMVATVALGTWIAGGDVLLALLSGGLMFGAVFMATDYATTPVTKYGRLIFGFGAGLITFLIRQFGGFPEGVMFSILVMNAISPFLNNLMGRKYGYKRDNITPSNVTKKGAK